MGEIEDGVPIPVMKRQPNTEAGRIANAMEVGQSVFCDLYSEALAVRRALYRAGHKVAWRKLEDGWRVWRTT